MHRLWSFTLALLLMLPAQAALGASFYSQTWDDPADGTASWFGVDDPVTTTWQASGGNGGGYLQTTQLDATGPLDTGARAFDSIPELTGDFTGRRWTLLFDLRLESGEADAAMFRLRGTPPGQGWVIDLSALPSFGEWTSYMVVFDAGWSEDQARANGWTPDNQHPILHPEAPASNSWSETLASVATFSIRISGEAAELTTGLDNVVLDSVMSTVPEPSTAILLGLGLGALARRGRRAPTKA